MIAATEVKIVKRVMSKNGKPLGFLGRMLRHSKHLLCLLLCGIYFSELAHALNLRPVSFCNLLAASLTPQGAFNGQDRGQYLLWCQFTVKASGNYPANGDTLDLSVIAPAGCGQPPVPGTVNIQSNPLSGSVHSGFTYTYIQGTTQKNGKMQVLQANGANNTLQDIGASNPYPAAVSGDNIVGSCAFVYAQ
jgi:hypothetical protein